MSDRANHDKRPPRQEWKANAFVRTLYTIWKILFAGLKIAAGALATVLLVVIVCGFVFVNILGEYLEDEVMTVAAVNLEDLELDKTSFIYYLDHEGEIQILQRIYSGTNRQWVYYEDIPEELIQACVAIEDKRFFEHQGVDWITTAKACISMFFGGSEFGGSTITQQFIKNYYGDDDVTVQRKVMEIFRAIAMEKTYDKEVIIEWYLNTVYFGEGCYGVKSAAANYFGKELQDMNVAELASLIGITNNPSLFRPYRTTLDKGGMTGAERNRVRQVNILFEMRNQGWLSEIEYRNALDYELVFKRGIEDEDRWVSCINEDCGYQGAVRTLLTQESMVGVNQYYCPKCSTQLTVTTDATQSVYSWYVDEVLDQVAKALAEADGIEASRIENWNTEAEKELRTMYRDKLARGGYHIYTPFNADVQAAVDSVYTDLSKIPTVQSGQQLQSAMVIVDNSTGDIVAMAGGVGEKTTFDAYNRATDAKLQVGSALKPLTVYAPAFELGVISPATVVDDLPLMYNDNSSFPKNDNFQYNYTRTIWRGIVSSVNAIAVNTLDRLGLETAYDYGKNKFAISDLTDYYPTSSGSILTDVGYSPLGMGALTVGATVRDVTCAYATLANDGVYREGRVWTKVYDSYGNLVLSNEQDSWQVIGEKALNYLNYCLDSAVASGTGTAADLYAELGIDVAGKTGSTSSFKDRYFAGFTGHYTAAVWCGFDTPEQIVLTNVYTNPAARLWRAVMVQVHENLETVPLYDDTGMISVTVCLESGKLTSEACTCDIRGNAVGRIQTVLVYPEDAPTEFCDKHIIMDYCSIGGCTANEYCQKFASVGAISLQQKSLVKFTQSRLDQMLEAEDNGLLSVYLRDDYIYLVDDSGNPTAFYGVHGGLNAGVEYPCKVCTVHTQAAWEKFLVDNPWIENGQPKPEEPTEPEENPDDNTESGDDSGTEENPDENTDPGENSGENTDADNGTDPENPTEGGSEGEEEDNTEAGNSWFEDLMDSLFGD